MYFIYYLFTEEDNTKPFFIYSKQGVGSTQAYIKHNAKKQIKGAMYDFIRSVDYKFCIMPVVRDKMGLTAESLNDAKKTILELYRDYRLAKMDV